MRPVGAFLGIQVDNSLCGIWTLKKLILNIKFLMLKSFEELLNSYAVAHTSQIKINVQVNF